jgi:hypothetical protein
VLCSNGGGLIRSCGDSICSANCRESAFTSGACLPAQPTFGNASANAAQSFSVTCGKVQAPGAPVSTPAPQGTAGPQPSLLPSTSTTNGAAQTAAFGLGAILAAAGAAVLL